ncbi:hypothetical protein F5X99DRAFT_113941 [Biscogniauxia marginata]|nr:hypothetical protein F5X99DRAFT_113941 [Biscogniauxia marginata]
MCKHVLNAQVAIRSPCCLPGKKWFDCAECHREQESHPLLQAFEMTFACKKCRKCFRKDAQEFEEADEYCPHCDNHFVIDALVPKPALTVEGDDARVDNRMIKDDRVREDRKRNIFDPQTEADKLG